MVTPLRKKRLQSGRVLTRALQILKPSSLSWKDCHGANSLTAFKFVDVMTRICSERMPAVFRTASRADNSMASFESMYKVLAERVMRSLPKAESVDGETTSLTKMSFATRFSADLSSFCPPIASNIAKNSIILRFALTALSPAFDAMRRNKLGVMRIVQLLSNSTKTQESRPTRL